MTESPRLDALAQPVGQVAPAEILARFVGWAEARGLTPYPAQEEAFLELLDGKHVVLDTPTGSGKSLVAQLLHFKALCEGARSFYTSPVKALVSEKFFALCADFGAESVGMLTGDASINAGAPIVCCTAEVLAQMALRQGAELPVPYAVLDEFHFYSDPGRGWAWQVPLLLLPRTTFLLMSATLGDTGSIRRDLAARSGRAVALVASSERPVPLDYAYCETPLHETVSDLLEERKAPIYVVSFTQREAAELAQSLTSLAVATRAERDEIARALGDASFDSPYGKELARLIRAGIGIHHAGLLPKYRLLVEQLSQQGLLKVISGTDTLGVGVNIPIRTVLFTKLAKFDGRRVGALSVREFKQIAGRAGRKGFDDRGSVACQAPEHVIENKRMRARASQSAKKKKKEVTRKPPPGFVGWNEESFKRLIERPPEPLVSRFRVTHGMLVLLLRHAEEQADPRRSWRAVAELIGTCHEDERQKRRLLRDAAQLVRGLRAADIVRLERDSSTGLQRLRVASDLQWDFSLHHALSLYLVEATSSIEARDEAFALELLSLVEAVLEDPRAILWRQLDRLKSDLMSRMKAEGVPFEERIRRLEEVQPLAPSRDFIERTFAEFARRHPWVRRQDVKPKSIARELVEGYWDFDHYVRFYGLQRSEGLLLRYLGEVYGSLVQTVPAAAKTDAVYDVIAYLRAMIERVDSSLVAEWESLLHPELAAPEPAAPALRSYDLAADPRELRARVRAELHRLTRALAARDWEEAARCVRQDPRDPWPAARFAEALEPFRAEYGEIVFAPRARANEWTRLEPAGPRRWRATQVLVDRADDNLWCLEGEIDLGAERDPVGPLLRLARIGT
ncbi:MAG: DEAD/DEAH box helicase [Myxococcota bacterium]